MFFRIVQVASPARESPKEKDFANRKKSIKTNLILDPAVVNPNSLERKIQDGLHAVHESMRLALHVKFEFLY